MNREMNILLIARNEWKKAWHDLRFRLAVVLLPVVFVCGTAAFVSNWHNQQEEYKAYDESQASHHYKEWGWSLTDVAISTQEFRQPPRLSQLIDPCGESRLPGSFRYSAFGLKDYYASYSTGNPLTGQSDNFSWAFVVKVMFSFITLLLAFNAVSGEKERHTLGLVLTYPVSRWQVLTGKVLCVLGQVGGLLAACIVLAIGVLLAGGIAIDGLFLWLCVGFWLLGIAYLAVFACLGVLASVVCRSSRGSLLLCVGCWLLFVLLLPGSKLWIGRHLYPTEVSFRQMQDSLLADVNHLIAETPAEAFATDDEYPFNPIHRERSAVLLRINDARLKRLEEWDRINRKQYERVEQLVACSPVELFTRANACWLDGGYMRFRKNEVALESFCHDLLEWFRKEDAQDPESPHWLNPQEHLSTSRRPVEEAKTPVPVYQESYVGLLQRLSNALIPVLALLLTGFGCLAGAWYRFRRYDVR